MIVVLGSVSALDAVAAVIPTPGSVLNSVRPEESIIPAPQTEQLELPPSVEGQTLDPNGARVHVAAFRIVGNDEIDSATLHSLIDAEAGKPLNLYELNKVARLITDYYRSKGYPVARAVIPAQKVEFGNVTIEVIEGRIDGSTFTGNTLYSQEFLQRWTAPLNGKVARTDTLEERILTVNDLPGLSSRAVLTPGAEYGATTTQFVSTEKPYEGEVSVNNYGRREIGRTRADAAVSLNNPLGIGDQVGVRSSYSEGGLLKLGGANYSLPLNTLGTRLALSYTDIRYRIGGDLRVLDIKGKSQLGSATVVHPFQRSQAQNLYGTLGARTFHGEQTALGFETSNNRVSVAEVGTAWNHVDDGLNVATASARASSNFSSYKDDDNSVGQRLKLDGDASYLYNLTPVWAVRALVAAQWSADTLADAEKFSLGGPSSVRGYPSADVLGDRGVFANLELRYRTRIFTAPGYFSAFVDGGHVSRIDPVEGTDKSNSIGSAGLGATFFPTRAISLELMGAVPTGNHETSDFHDNGRLWANLTTRF
jgi:hemolysin activation/secretion protein